jgi:eukaryotic-like serine/threonine-protein kinase
VVGHYRLVRQLGSGGMGTVYEAVRVGADFEQRVAVKLLRPGALDVEQVERFRQERRILAALHHPGICLLLDGGITVSGRPYLVMEYIEGLPVTEYAGLHDLPVRDRLALFRSICGAVAHAHRHLVVHRDLKPGNILVTPEGAVKLLDFGIAKLLPAATLASPPLTATVVRSFTPGYASPEQLRGDPISTATDVYSLGVILYELLTDVHPFRFDAGATPLELVRLRETEPVRPSQARRAEAPRGAGGRRELAGELDTIVLRAMHPDPQRRYLSVEQLEADVGRYLAGLRVLAQADTLAYRTRKFLGRHRAGASAVLLVFLALGGGLGLAGIQARRAAQERDRAQLEARKAQRVSAFLADVLRAADPWANGRDVRVEDLLDLAEARARTELAGEPDVLAEVLTAVGLSYGGLGRYDPAESALAEALRIRRALPGTPAEQLAAAAGNLAGVLVARGDLARASPLLRDAIAAFRPACASDSIRMAALRAQLGQVWQGQGDMAAATREHQAALVVQRSLLGSEHEDVAATLNNLAVVLGQQAQYAEAEVLQREALRIQRVAAGPDHPDLGPALANLGFVLMEQGRYAAADSFYRQALDLRLRLLGEDHPEVAWARYSHATLRLAMADAAGAAALAEQVLARRGTTLPDGHPMVASALHVLGRSRMAQQAFAEAEPLLRESLALRTATLPPEHWLLATAASVLGECLTGLRRYAEAEPLLVRSHDRLLELRGATHPRTREARARLQLHYQQRGDTARAARYR